MKIEPKTIAGAGIVPTDLKKVQFFIKKTWKGPPLLAKKKIKIVDYSTTNRKPTL